jgi:amylosucrase
MKIDELFQARLDAHHDELRWLYMEVYNNGDMFAELCENMHTFAVKRDAELRRIDSKREKNPDWFRGNDMLGMMMYIDNFAGNLKGVRQKLDYIESCHVNCVHLMPFLESPKGRSDGGYAVSDFRKVQPNLGTMDDLVALSKDCHKRQINLCMDFVMNHTSEEHEWAKRARNGEGEYMSRYFFYDSRFIPDQYDSTVPQVFPTTAPGNFTWLDDLGQYVMTSFYPYQWDLNYRNPRVFNEMMYNFLFLANHGMDIIRIDAVPYIWKELGTSCRNLPRVHTIVRMMRIISQIVCPGVLLLGEVVMEPEKVVPYFGTVEKPECHMLYNVTTMATTWNTVATGDARLLKKQMDIVNGLPKEYLFLNYLRCHDDLGWGLDYPTLKEWGMDEVAHKRFLNLYFRGMFEGSESRGELYNDDPLTGDARFCGTTASMCGLESAIYELDEEKLARAIRFDLMLHAFMFTQSGIPMLYSGDEIGQLNDYTYKEDPDKKDDSRYLHRGAFKWELASLVTKKDTVQQQMFDGLSRLEEIRRTRRVFDSGTPTYTYDVKEDSILGILRENDEERFIALYNFARQDRMARIDEPGTFVNLLTGEEISLHNVDVRAHDFLWLSKSKKETGAKRQTPKKTTAKKTTTQKK